MKHFSLLIKPASADCNLRCEYCFYLDRCALYPRSMTHRMSDHVLDRLVRTFMNTDQPEHVFGWQGGEPTLMGVEFFKKAVALQQSHGRNRSVVANGLQTNGTLITADMAQLFAEYRFLVGVSLDGPADIHDTYRRNAAGAGTHGLVLRGIDLLQKHDVAFNILCLVSRSNAHRGAEVYEYLVERGYLYHQYIPCVEPAAAGRGLAPFAIGGAEWGEFMCAVFDAWAARDVRRVSVRLFDSILSVLVDNQRTTCHMGRNCCHYLVVEHNGDVFPCDFFVEQKLRLGNIANHGWDELLRAPEYRAFGKQKEQCNAACLGCPWAAFCAGDCLKDRLLSQHGDPRRTSVLCEGWKRFYAHAMPRFEELALAIRSERATGSGKVRPGPDTPPNLGRNDPCPCGSGQKYKKCCGK